MALIPPGIYWRGSSVNEKWHEENETPRHKVTISKAFWIGETEVTQKQWFAITREKPWKNKTKASSRHPATYISWKDIQNKFLPKLGRQFRFPTDAEWEYACRVENSRLNKSKISNFLAIEVISKN